MVHRSPLLYGFTRTTWTLEMIQEKICWLNGETGKRAIGIPGVSKILKRLNVCYKRGKASVHSPDLHYNRKMAKIQHAHLLNLLDPERFPLLYEDELTYYRRPVVGKVYGSEGKRGAKKAKQEEGYDSAGRLAACIDVQTGAIIFRQRATYPVKEMYRFFYYVEQHYPRAERVFIVLDNWPNHFHDFVKENLARGAKKITLLSLPTYAPWENPVEKLWLKLKKENLVHHPFGGKWEELKQIITEWMEQYRGGSRDLLHFVGLDTKMERYRSIFATLQAQERTDELLAMPQWWPD
jgi:DDE superfamily endonuclease